MLFCRCLIVPYLVTNLAEFSLMTQSTPSGDEAASPAAFTVGENAADRGSGGACGRGLV